MQCRIKQNKNNFYAYYNCSYTINIHKTILKYKKKFYVSMLEEIFSLCDIFSQLHAFIFKNKFNVLQSIQQRASNNIKEIKSFNPLNLKYHFSISSTKIISEIFYIPFSYQSLQFTVYFTHTEHLKSDQLHFKCSTAYVASGCCNWTVHV